MLATAAWNDSDVPESESAAAPKGSIPVCHLPARIARSVRSTKPDWLKFRDSVGSVMTQPPVAASAAMGRSQVILFMHQPALQRFQRSKGWKAGVDGSVALATLGAGEQIDTETARKPIIGFIFSNKGLMYNLTFEGAKITRIRK